VAASKNLYRAEPTGALIIEPLDLLTLIYQRRSGITHMVSEPVPQMLSAMGADAVDAATLTQRLSADFDVGEGDAAIAVIAERLEELANLGLVERIASA
jgi:PqqD family protein of HPr-rel-A system